MKSEFKFKIAAPCNARWEEMTGDDQRRFCAQCGKHVYNFSDMKPEEISSLLAMSGRPPCARFYQRKDGTVLLENCPAGLERITRRIKIMVCSTVALLVFSAGALFAGSNRGTRSQSYSRVTQLWNQAVWTVKGWMGIQPPILMGEICAPAPVSSQITTNP